MTSGWRFASLLAVLLAQKKFANLRVGDFVWFVVAFVWLFHEFNLGEGISKSATAQNSNLNQGIT